MKEPLLAKSPTRDGRTVTLEAHLADTEECARLIFAPGSRIRRRWLRFFKVPAELEARWERSVRIAALLHDLGKANGDFFDAVTHATKEMQTLRHEHLSALVLSISTVRTWLEGSSLVDFDVICASVLSHHFKAAESGEHMWGQPRGLRSEVRLFLDHGEVKRTLMEVARLAELPPPPVLPLGPWKNAPPWTDAHALGVRAAREFARTLRKDPDRRAMHLAVKCGVIVCDAAASALVREGHPLAAWVNETLHGPPLTAGDIEDAILRPRREAIEKRILKPFEYQRFQVLAGEQGPRSLLLAACGAGKTVAAWRWLASRAEEEPFGSAVFLYPTRGTATEGFRDYVGWAPADESALLHGSSTYELERILENPSDAVAGKAVGVSEADARLFALGSWSKRYFSATVDQFLAFLEHGYASTCLLPRLVDSAVVVDEVHSFDTHLFAVFASFLENFDIPVLAMTATLPPKRRGNLTGRGLVVFPSEAHRAHLVDLESKECHPRYRLTYEPLPGANEAAFARAIDAVREGKRVLVVVNTVSRCQAWSEALGRELGRKPLTYHSRFRLCDRQVKHAETVRAFQDSDDALAVTTQVCEMSLDLDTDLLVTEVAPVPSLVQRFGRANRHLRRGPAFRGELVVIPAPSHLPYEKEDLDLAERFLSKLAGRAVSQRDLAASLDEFSPPEASPDGSSRLLDSGYYATPGSLRDGDDLGAAAILERDRGEVLERIRRRQRFDGFELIVPKRLVQHDVPGLPPYLGTVADALYDVDLGLRVDA